MYGYIIKANFGTNHSIKSICYLEVQMLVVHKINYTSTVVTKTSQKNWAQRFHDSMSSFSLENDDVKSSKLCAQSFLLVFGTKINYMIII